MDAQGPGGVEGVEKQAICVVGFWIYVVLVNKQSKRSKQHVRTHPSPRRPRRDNVTVNRHRTAIWRRGQLQGSLCQLFWSCVHTNRLLQEGSAREMRSLLAFSEQHSSIHPDSNTEVLHAPFEDDAHRLECCTHDWSIRQATRNLTLERDSPVLELF